jgi:hypothetical protein
MTTVMVLLLPVEVEIFMRKKLPRPMTATRLRGLVYYDKETGIFFSRKSNKVLGSPKATGYLTVQLGVKSYSLHRLAWLYRTGEFPVGVIDHLDHNKQNNAWYNLRETTQVDNCKNQQLAKSNSSGFTGVRWNIKKKRWTAAIKVKRKNIHLGSFDSFEDAVIARQEANEEYGFHENHGKPLEDN